MTVLRKRRGRRRGWSQKDEKWSSQDIIEKGEEGRSEGGDTHPHTHIQRQAQASTHRHRHMRTVFHPDAAISLTGLNLMRGGFFVASAEAMVVDVCTVAAPRVSNIHLMCREGADQQKTRGTGLVKCNKGCVARTGSSTGAIDAPQ